MRSGCPGAIKRPLEVHAEDAIPSFVVGAVQIAVRDETGRSSVIDEDIQPAKGVDGSIHHRAAAGIVVHVALKR